jgi:hypothetical protein
VLASAAANLKLRHYPIALSFEHGFMGMQTSLLRKAANLPGSQGTGWMMAPWWLRRDDQGLRRHLAVHQPIHDRDLSLVEVLASAILKRGERWVPAC